MCFSTLSLASLTCTRYKKARVACKATYLVAGKPLELKATKLVLPMVKETNVESNGDSGDNALRLGDQQGHLPPLQMGKALND